MCPAGAPPGATGRRRGAKNKLSERFAQKNLFLAADRRGYWEERGYHNRADPWLEERYSYQETPE